MSNAIEALDGGAERSAALGGLHENVWASGLVAAVAWAAAAIATIALPDVVPWGSAGLFAIIMASGALALVVLAFIVPRLGQFGQGWIHYGSWLIAIGVWLTLWELTTAKFGWLPKPFFSPPNGLLNVYVTEASRLLICIGYTLRLWSIGFASGTVVGYALGVALGWSKRFSYWGMPLLKLIGPVPATAWIPCTFFFFPTTFAASVFIVALSAGIPVAILTSSGVASVNRAYYDVGRNLGASAGISCRRSLRPLRCRMCSSACSWPSIIRSPSSSLRRCSAPSSASDGTSSSRPPIRATPTSMRRS